MGILENGVWNPAPNAGSTSSESFERKASEFRNYITPDGPFKPESNRYHLYGSLACPWSHRTLIFHQLKDLAL